MKYARIEDGVVVELVELDVAPAERYHESLAATFRPAAVGCQEGWRVQGDEVVAPPVDIAGLRATKRAAIEAAYLAAVARGCPFGEGDAVQIDAESRGNLGARATRAGFVLQGTEGFTWPVGGMPYRTKANVWVTFAPAEMVALAQQADDLFTAIRIRYAVLKELLAAAGDDEAAIAAINPAAGWPN